MGIYQGLCECKPEAQASASILAYTRLRFGACIGKKLSAARLSVGRTMSVAFRSAKVALHHSFAERKTTIKNLSMLSVARENS